MSVTLYNNGVLPNVSHASARVLYYLWRAGRAECTAAKDSEITRPRSNSSAGAATGLWMMSRIVPGEGTMVVRGIT